MIVDAFVLLVLGEQHEDSFEVDTNVDRLRRANRQGSQDRRRGRRLHRQDLHALVLRV